VNTLRTILDSAHIAVSVNDTIDVQNARGSPVDNEVTIDAPDAVAIWQVGSSMAQSRHFRQTIHRIKDFGV
jgi:hypothetical protein